LTSAGSPSSALFTSVTVPASGAYSSDTALHGLDRAEHVAASEDGADLGQVDVHDVAELPLRVVGDADLHDGGIAGLLQRTHGPWCSADRLECSPCGVARSWVREVAAKVTRGTEALSRQQVGSWKQIGARRQARRVGLDQQAAGPRPTAGDRGVSRRGRGRRRGRRARPDGPPRPHAVARPARLGGRDHRVGRHGLTQSLLDRGRFARTRAGREPRFRVAGAMGLRVGCSRASAAASSNTRAGRPPNAPPPRGGGSSSNVVRARRSSCLSEPSFSITKSLFARLRSAASAPRSSGRPRRSRVRAWCGAACAAAPGSRPPGPRYRTGSGRAPRTTAGCR